MISRLLLSPPSLKSHFLAAALIGASSLAGAYAQGGPVPGKLVIKYKETATSNDIARTVNNARLRLHRYLQTEPMAWRSKLGLVTASTSLHTDYALNLLKSDPAVEHVEQQIAFTKSAVPDDPAYEEELLWGVYGDLSTPSSIYGSQAAEAWANGYIGSHDVHVAIIDDGVRITHQDLAANIWTNTADPVNGVDDDGNGYIDDLHGWNFVDDNNAVYQSGDDHATLLAGVIGAVGGNGYGLVGVNWNVSMIPLRALAATGTTEDVVAAIDYCVALKQKGTNIVAINASWGAEEYSQLLHDAVIRAAKAGILFVAAAGNSGSDNDTITFLPANLDTTVGTPTETAASYNAVISVTAISATGELPAFASYGAETVHLGAPGHLIFTTHYNIPGFPFAEAEGTSLAAPFVTGAVALYASTHPFASAAEIREAILNSVIPTPSLSGKTTTGGRLNLSDIITPPTVAGRYIFYNSSAWDVVSDDDAIAPDKSALLPGGTATLANYTSYSRGINGIMIDIANPSANLAGLSASDFTFKVGNNSTVSGWADAPAPSSITVRPGAGVGGSSRITIIWPNNAIAQTWLQVTLLSTPTTGLLTNDVFYFGNAKADTGNSPNNTVVNVFDQARVRANYGPNKGIDSLFDIDRNKTVNVFDEALVLANRTTGGTDLNLITPQ